MLLIIFPFTFILPILINVYTITMHFIILKFSIIVFLFIPCKYSLTMHFSIFPFSYIVFLFIPFVSSFTPKLILFKITIIIALCTKYKFAFSFFYSIFKLSLIFNATLYPFFGSLSFYFIINPISCVYYYIFISFLIFKSIGSKSIRFIIFIKTLKF